MQASLWGIIKGAVHGTILKINPRKFLMVDMNEIMQQSQPWAIGEGTLQHTDDERAEEE